MRRKRQKTYTRIRHHESLQYIARRYAEGETVKALSERYDIDASTVRSIARRHGVPIRPVGRPAVTR